MSVPSLDVESLLACDTHLRALAHGLLADVQLAEDVAQETWLAALERRKGATGPVPAWLARVARN